MRINTSRTVRAITAALAVGLIATGCSSERDNDAKDGAKDTFVFAGAGDPGSLDPALASDGETFRVTRQAFEALLEHESGGSKLVGGLAETWESNDAGTVWTFNLRKNVKFQDGETFDADAVCANYDHWFNWAGTYQSSAVSYYWQSIMGGFAKNEDAEAPKANYKSCTAKDANTAVIEVNEPSANLPGGFSLQALAIHSPKAIKEYEKQDATAKGDAITYPKYSQEAGTVAGTGPYKITKWNKSNKEVSLERFDGYWGDKAKVKNLVFRTIDTEEGRRQALQAGDIDGYDLVAPADIKTLEGEGYEVPTRDVFNLFYVGMTQSKNKALKKPEVRQAIAHAIDRENIVKTQLPEGGKVATQFMPDTVAGYSDQVKQYAFDTNKAKKLLKDAGESKLSLEFCYPTEVTRPYMPAPQDMFELMKADLEKAGITVVPKAMKWAPDYLDATEAGSCALHMLGWTGDFNDGFNFIGTWFAGADKQWGFKDAKVFDSVNAASKETDPAARVEAYKKANETIMEYLPGLPISSSPPAIAFAKNVNPPKVSPLTQENFAEVSFK
ncbi:MULTISPECIES: ABC transporter substrate-binding protein [Streptomyces]|uniref:Peptide/nickel transport system substrate-binding protein n=2 Tax=Streptomyces TaxID=1883 RepID=A0ABS4V4W3_9ACTN|nr:MULTISPECIES: ABC transporter substrate-binding protein [Streptomyces]KQZ07052.1 peptide ABC transporter substrate-binding protein [Streptomyces sp. Root55]MBP2358926.1 peptide/nickel transport system substrate-binding protein [Streptomyces clavifer]MDX2745603.1 ABC transporter substrate-binding protein [Streptomyces sp. NRRL_B-2557]RPK81653.1 Periplasmic dipeptide transport protein precursor [Streptomyces sp. ADI97-07]WRY84314.1 ABC transporter substrate-binding protein [Streptomyces clavi